MVLKNGEKILILTGRFGEGHLQVAKAIQEATIAEFPNVDSTIIDFMAWAYPNLYPVSHYVYMKGIKTFPQLYGFFYQKTYETSYFSKKLNSIFSIGIKKMLKLIQTVKPTVVVSTYPFASSVLSKLKENGLTNVPLVTVITDHTQHSYWLHPYTDLYIVGSQETKEKLIEIGIPASRVNCTGIPIRRRFMENRNRKELIEKYGLEPNVPTVLVMGGGEGLIGKGFLNFKTLESIPKKLQFIILCGHNEKLRQHIQLELINSKHHVAVIGYIDSVDELMAVSDIIVTKPGGVTTSEALAMELPMLLYKPLPGQEQDNAQYLIEAGVALQAKNPSELVERLTEMLEDKKVLTNMKKNARNIQTKKAAIYALRTINQSQKKRTFITKGARYSKRLKMLRHITISILFNLLH